MSSASNRSLAVRVRERFRYGLATQEALDSLRRWFRITVCPYYLVAEGQDPTSPPDPEAAAGYEIRFLGEADLEAMHRIASTPVPPGRLEALRFGQCLGLFADGRLAAYTWSRTDIIPSPLTRMPLRPLGDDEAYLFGAYVSRDHRGRRLAPILRQALYRRLNATGRTRFYSITLAFNRSSRRFKARLGARETELRLVIGVAGRRHLDIRLRRLQADSKSPAFKTLNASTPKSRESMSHEVAPPQL